MPIGPQRGAVPCATTTGSLSANAVAMVSEHAPTPAGRRARIFVAIDAPHANGDYGASESTIPSPPRAFHAPQMIKYDVFSQGAGTTGGALNG